MDTLNILLEITVYSAIIFTAIMLLKACFKNKMSPFLHYAIWLVLVLRLIMPMTIASPVRLFVIPAPSQSQAAIEQTQPQTYDPVSESDINKPVIADTQPPTAAVKSYIPSKPQEAAVTTQTPTAMPLPQVLTLIWLSGAGVCLMYLAALYASLRRKLKKNSSRPSKALMALFEKTKADMGIKADIKLICMYEYGTPSLMFPRTIMMPVDALVSMDEEQTKFALRHELMHYKRSDHIMSILLSMLNAVYWFNPFVWLAFRQMRVDMETACDSKVVKLLSASARSRYASLILNLSSRPAHRQLALGMSDSTAKKAAQRRVTGIFMKGKSSMSVKLLSVMLTVILILTCFTTACQPLTGMPGNPEKYTGWIPQPPSSYKTSEHWNETVQSGKVNIVIDTDVFVPDVTKYPVVKLEPAVFAQQRVDELVSYFAKGKQLYLPHVMTKADYQKQLDEAKLGEKENGEYVVTEWSLNEVKSLEQKLKSAPEDSPIIYTDTTLTYNRDIESGKELTASGKGFLNVNFDNGEGGEASISISNFVEGQSVYDYSDRYSGPTCFSYFAGRLGFALTESMYRDTTAFFTLPGDEDDWPGVEEMFSKVDVTPEQAVAQADEVISGLGIKGLMLVSAEKYVTPEAPEKSGYMVQYARESGGIPLCWHNGVSWYAAETPPEYSPPFDEERLSVYVSKQGLESLQWDGCASVLETVNENTELLPFDTIKQALKDLIKYKNSCSHGNPGEDLTVTVTSAELRMGYINTDNPRQALMIPVWVFSAYETLTQEGKVTFVGNNTTYMLSAIDGGVIEWRP